MNLKELLTNKTKEKYVADIIIDYKNQLERHEKHLNDIKNYKKQYKYSLWRYTSYCIKKTRKRNHKREYITDTLCSFPLSDTNTIETEIVNWGGVYDVW